MDRASRLGGQVRPRREEVVLSLASEVLRTSGGLRFAALGASMVPTIFPGDILIIRHETARSARCGDVVLLMREGQFCAHRLVEKSEERGRFSLVTRGDAHTKNDPPLAENELLGCVAAVVRGGRRIELSGRSSARQLLARWAVRQWSGALKWQLRWHLMHARLARYRDEYLADAQPNAMERI
ncbi:MAG: S24 family peptidase [Candidatus Acidiferrales bacterium]